MWMSLVAVSGWNTPYRLYETTRRANKRFSSHCSKSVGNQMASCAHVVHEAEALLNVHHERDLHAGSSHPMPVQVSCNCGKFTVSSKVAKCEINLLLGKASMMQRSLVFLLFGFSHLSLNLQGLYLCSLRT